MKPAMLAAVFAVALCGLSPASQAQDASALIASKGCGNCHAVDQKKMGPSFKDISAKYSGKAGADADIVAKIRDGKGHPKSTANEADIKTMVDYILAIK